MPIGEFVNVLPPVVFLVVHLAIFVVASYFAWHSFTAEARSLGWGFILFALAEISYMTYHLDWTVFLFAHTLSEVLVLLGVITVFTAATRRIAVRDKAGTVKRQQAGTR